VFKKLKSIYRKSCKDIILKVFREYNQLHSFTTKGHKGFHKGTQRSDENQFTPHGEGVNKLIFKRLNLKDSDSLSKSSHIQQISLSQAV
jgi:hypothetical protein